MSGEHHHGQHLHWGAEALWESLQAVLPGVGVEVLARVESTNTRLLERARQAGGAADAPITRPGELDALPRRETTPHGRRAADLSPCLLVAEQQTRGRGRMGRDWVSSPGASLTFSLALPLAPAQWGGLSLAVGLALAEALDPQPAGAVPRLALKWPNDLWLVDGPWAAAAPGQPRRGRKLGGILIETVSVGDQRLCVVGVGLNVAPQPPGQGEGLAHGYACLQELQPAMTAPRALAAVAVPLARELRRFERQGLGPRLADYARRDLLQGQPVLTQSGSQPLAGMADGVDEQGALLLRHQDDVHRVLSGEVSVRLATAGA